MPEDANICVYVIDDDASVRQAMEMLLLSAGIHVWVYESAEAFLKSDFREHGSCLIADFKMPQIDGLQLQQQLNEKGIRIPIIFLTAFDSTEDRQRAFRGGAVGFFRKPVDDQALLDVIHWALSGSGPPDESA